MRPIWGSDERKVQDLKKKPRQPSDLRFQISARSRPRGFTLLEVMVALCIMAIVLMSVYRLQSQAIAMSMESRFYTQAPLLARTALTRFEEAIDRQMATSQGDFGREYPGYQWKITVEDTVSVALGPDISKDMKRIEVQVTLNNGEYAYGFRTYRFKRE